MYTGFSEATVNPPVASGFVGRVPNDPFTSLSTWRAPLTRFLRPVVKQLAIRVVNGSGGLVLVLIPKPSPTFVAPYLSSLPLLSTSSGDRGVPAMVT